MCRLHLHIHPPKHPKVKQTKIQQAGNMTCEIFENILFDWKVCSEGKVCCIRCHPSRPSQPNDISMASLTGHAEVDLSKPQHLPSRRIVGTKWVRGHVAGTGRTWYMSGRVAQWAQNNLDLARAWIHPPHSTSALPASAVWNLCSFSFPF